MKAGEDNTREGLQNDLQASLIYLRDAPQSNLPNPKVHLRHVGLAASGVYICTAVLGLSSQTGMLQFLPVVSYAR